MQDLFGQDTPLPLPQVKGKRKAELAHEQMLIVFGKAPGQVCRGCKFFYYVVFANKYPKCKLSGCDGRSAASDWSGKWQACGKYEERG